MSETFVLAIDQGTTGTTALLLDEKGEVRARGYAELPQYFPQPGWVEHDPMEIWQSTLTAVSQVLRIVEAGRESIAAIGITNQRETVVLWDRTTGEPVAPAIVWQDRRTADRCAALKKAGAERDVRRITGLVLDPYFSATKIEWLLKNQPGLRARVKRGEIAFGTVDSWLLWKLTGERVHATEPTNASRTLLFDIARLRWDDKMLELFGVPASMLPKVMTSSGVFGTTRGVSVLRDNIPISGIAGDQQAALFGQGCVEAGQSKNTYGTGCFLLLNTGERRVVSKSGLITTVACGPNGEPAYALEGSVFIAGAALQWLRDGLGFLERASESEEIAQSVEDSGGVVMVPAFVGLGAPYWRPDVRGSIVGLTRGSTRAHIVRAALESIAFQTRDLVEAMASDAGAAPSEGVGKKAGVKAKSAGGAAVRGIRVKLLRVDGGAAANDFLMQYQADLLGVPVQRPAMLETTALGAGLLAGIGVGFWEGQADLDAARKVERVFTPGGSKTWRAEEYERWQRAVRGALASGE